MGVSEYARVNQSTEQSIRGVNKWHYSANIVHIISDDLTYHDDI